MKQPNHNAFSLIELLTVMGLVTLLSLGVVPFLARYPRALLSMEQRQSAVILLDSQIERVRCAPASGSVGDGETVLVPDGPQAGGIPWGRCVLRVEPCRVEGVPEGLRQATVTVEWRAVEGATRSVTRTVLLPPKGTGGRNGS